MYRVFDWQARTACAAGDLLAFLRYGGTSQSHNGYSRHSHDLRTAKGSSWMRIVHVILDAFPEVVSKCLEQEIPHLEIKMDFGYPPIHTREQLINCLTERGGLNIAIGGSTSSIPDTRDKALFQSLQAEWTSRRISAIQEMSDRSRTCDQGLRTQTAIPGAYASVGTNDRKNASSGQCDF